MRQIIIRLTTTVCVATALLCTATTTPAADDLFSSDSLKQVFNPAPPQTKTPPSPPQQSPVQPVPPQQPPTQTQPQSRALDPAEIPTFLMLMGYQSEDLGDGVFKTTLKKGEWNLPYAFVISPNKAQFWVTLSLNTLQEGVTIPAEKMQKMLNFNHQFGPIHFAYSEKTRRIYVCRALKNDGLDPAEVKQVIETLADLAINNEDMWNHTKWQSAQQSPTQQPQVQQTQPQTQVQQPPQAPVQSQPTPPHVGTWRSTAPDNSTFQLTLNADGSFVLYHVHDSTTDKSVGRYTLAGNNLTLLMSETDKLEAYFTWYNNGTWRFLMKDAQPGAQGLMFAKA